MLEEKKESKIEKLKKMEYKLNLQLFKLKEVVQDNLCFAPDTSPAVTSKSDPSIRK
jgi:hypothetical protein